MNRPTPEQLARLREYAQQGGEYNDPEANAEAVRLLLAEVDALRHEVSAARLVRDMTEECRECAMADRERMHIIHDAAKSVAGAEFRAETNEAALVRLRSACLPVEEGLRRLDCHLDGPHFVCDPDHPEQGALCALDDALSGLASALAATPTDLADSQRREWMAQGAEMVATKLAEHYRQVADRCGRPTEMQALTDLIDDIGTLAAELRGGR